jgi:hypothetical protein
MNDELALRHLDLLRLELQTAIEIEHTTLPPYLTAAFSIYPDTNREAQSVIRGISMQEMLHMTLAANVLNAVGGKPDVANPAFVPGYPTNLPWHAPGFKVGLERFSRRQIEVFRTIEEPAPCEDFAHLAKLDQHADAHTVHAAFAAKNDDQPPPARGYHTIGEFYAAVIARLRWCVARLGEDRVFTGDRARQVLPIHYYGGGGNVIEVHDERSAVHALWTIVRQGEGTCSSVWDGSHETAVQLQPAHFYGYDELIRGRMYRIRDEPGHPTGREIHMSWEAAYPMRPNPRRQHYEHHPEIFTKLAAFDDLYFDLLRHLDAAYNGHQDRFRAAVAQMYDLRYRAVELLRTPDPDDEGRTLGPTWGSLPPGTHPALALWNGKHRFFELYPDL